MRRTKYFIFVASRNSGSHSNHSMKNHSGNSWRNSSKAINNAAEGTATIAATTAEGTAPPAATTKAREKKLSTFHEMGKTKIKK